MWSSFTNRFGTGATNQHSSVSGRREDELHTVAPQPLLPEPAAYVQHGDAMTLNMRRNYVRDRTQAALTYISEYDTSQKLESDPQYNQPQVRQRLQIIYGKADQVKQRINTALNNDDIHRRRRMMHTLGLPQRFPQPQNMKDSSVTTWITWMRDESNELIAAIDEEVTKRQDPDDPFDGTASGIFLPLQHENESTSRHQGAQPIDESKNRGPQNDEPPEGRLVEVQSPELQPNHHQPMETGEHGTTLQPGVQRSIQETDVVDTSRNRQEGPAKQRNREPHDGRVPIQMTTQRRVEESYASLLCGEQQNEDPFRTLRSFHKRQRGERQWENSHHTSVTLHSIVEGAVGGAGMNPKPQRVTKKNQPQDQPQTMTQGRKKSATYDKITTFKDHSFHKTQRHT